MHCISKLWNLDNKVYFLEQKLFEHSKIIDELELTFRKIRVLPVSSARQPRKQSFFENSIDIKKVNLLYGFNLFILLTYI